MKVNEHQEINSYHKLINIKIKNSHILKAWNLDHNILRKLKKGI